MAMAQQEEPRKLKKPSVYDELYPGRFIKAGELKEKKVTLTISDVDIEELVGDDGKKVKCIISFKESEKKLVACKTNGYSIKSMFGVKLAEWIGKRITIYPDIWNGEPCIRIWGSPDIERDIEITVSLPRRRPFNKTMHRVTIGAGPRPVASGKQPSGEPPTDAKHIADLRATASLDEFTRTKKSVWAVYAAAGADVPLEVQDAANMQREELEGEVE